MNFFKRGFKATLLWRQVQETVWKVKKTCPVSCSWYLGALGMSYFVLTVCKLLDGNRREKRVMHSNYIGENFRSLTRRIRTWKKLNILEGLAQIRGTLSWEHTHRLIWSQTIVQKQGNLMRLICIYVSGMNTEDIKARVTKPSLVSLSRAKTGWTHLLFQHLEVWGRRNSSSKLLVTWQVTWMYVAMYRMI